MCVFVFLNSDWSIIEFVDSTWGMYVVVVQVVKCGGGCYKFLMCVEICEGDR